MRTIRGPSRVAIAVAGYPAELFDGLGQGRVFHLATEAALDHVQAEEAEEVVGGVDGGGEDVGHGEGRVVGCAASCDGRQAIVTIAALAEVAEAELPDAQGAPIAGERGLEDAAAGLDALGPICRSGVSMGTEWRDQGSWGHSKGPGDTRQDAPWRQPPGPTTQNSERAVLTRTLTGCACEPR